MKRVLLGLLAMTMVLGSVFVAGCSKAADEPAQPNTEEPAPAEGQG